MSEPRIEQTGSKCPVCAADIISVTRLVANRPPEFMIIGPGGMDNYREEKSFHCVICGLMFAFPTPKSVSTQVMRLGEAYFLEREGHTAD